MLGRRHFLRIFSFDNAVQRHLIVFGVSVGLRHRLLPEYQWPAPLDDIHAAVGLLRSRAQELGTCSNKPPPLCVIPAAAFAEAIRGHFVLDPIGGCLPFGLRFLGPIHHAGIFAATLCWHL